MVNETLDGCLSGSMAPRVAEAWHSSEFDVLELVFDNLANHATRSDREELYRSIALAFFPGTDERHIWATTRETIGDQPFFPFFIRIHDRPNEWFKNLRLLQLRTLLNLNDTYYFRSELASSPVSEVISKINVLYKIVGEDQLKAHFCPPMKRSSALRHFPTFPTIVTSAYRAIAVRGRARIPYNY